MPTAGGSAAAAPPRWLLVVSVKDSGIGISSASLAKLFKTFSQVQHSTAEFGGTGLGLVISMRLCQKMGGEIVVQSEVDRGSVFTFTCVAELSATGVTPEQTQLTRRMGAERIEQAQVMRTTAAAQSGMSFSQQQASLESAGQLQSASVPALSLIHI